MPTRKEGLIAKFNFIHCEEALLSNLHLAAAIALDIEQTNNRFPSTIHYCSEA